MKSRTLASTAARLVRAARPVLLAATIGTLLAGCSKAPAGPVKKAPPKIPVTVGDVVRRDAPDVLTAIGNVETYSTVSLKAQVAGFVQTAHFTEGQEVRKGQLLFSIDPAPFETTLHKAEANLLRDQALARNAEADVRRYEELVQKDYVTRQQYDNARTDAEALQATIKADEAAVADARLNLGYCSICSPIDGRTGQLQVYPGNIVKANETVLVNIGQIHPIYVGFAVPEQRLNDLRRVMVRGKLAVRVAMPDGTPVAEAGVLSFVDNAVDETSGTIKLMATFTNQAGLLWPGQFVNVTVTLDVRRDSIMVPQAAIQTGQQGTYVFLLAENMTVRQQPVTVGDAVDGFVLVHKGLSPGERVVTDGQLRLTDGAGVVIRAVPREPGAEEPAAPPPGMTEPTGTGSSAPAEKGTLP
jgi:multidrug efflux system membrane fusion protein